MIKDLESPFEASGNYIMTKVEQSSPCAILGPIDSAAEFDIDTGEINPLFGKTIPTAETLENLPLHGDKGKATLYFAGEVFLVGFANGKFVVADKLKLLLEERPDAECIFSRSDENSSVFDAIEGRIGCGQDALDRNVN